MKYLVFFVCILILFLVLHIIEYKMNINFHERLNRPIYKNNTFYLDKNTLSKTSLENIQMGEKLCKEKNIVICCLLRNNSNIFEKSKRKLEFIGKNFGEYKIVLFENDSEDDTRDKIKNWSTENNNVILLDCSALGDYDCKLKLKKGYDYGQLSMDRIRKMAIYREQYLNYVKNNYSDYDYMLVVDFDLDGNQNIDGIYNSIGKQEEWDAIFINGKFNLPGTFGLYTIMYDALAHVGENEDSLKLDTSKYIKFFYFLFKFIKFFGTDIKNIFINDKNNLIPVKSAFNGYGLYKISSIKNSSYMGDNICEHNNLNLSIYDKGGKLFINPLWIGYFKYDGVGDFTDILKNLNNNFK
jgi:hypothetical protein